MKTINQVNGRLSQNPTVTRYLELREERNYRNKYWRQTNGNEQSLTGNYIFAAALKELKILGLQDIYQRRTAEAETHPGYYYSLKFTANLITYIDGIYIEVFNYDRNLSILPQTIREKVRSNQDFYNLNVAAEGLKLIRKYINRDIIGMYQIAYNCTAEEGKQLLLKYRYSCNIEDKPQDRSEYEYTGLRKLLKRRNILTDSFESITTLRRAWEEYRHTKFRNRRTLQVFNPFEMYDQIIEEYDEEEQIIIEEAQERINNSKIAWI